MSPYTHFPVWSQRCGWIGPVVPMIARCTSATGTRKRKIQGTPEDTCWALQDPPKCPHLCLRKEVAYKMPAGQRNRHCQLRLAATNQGKASYVMENSKICDRHFHSRILCYNNSMCLGKKLRLFKNNRSQAFLVKPFTTSMLIVGPPGWC